METWEVIPEENSWYVKSETQALTGKAQIEVEITGRIWRRKCSVYSKVGV